MKKKVKFSVTLEITAVDFEVIKHACAALLAMTVLMINGMKPGGYMADYLSSIGIAADVNVIETYLGEDNRRKNQ